MIYHSVGCTLKDKPKSKLFYSQEVPQLGGRSALIGNLAKTRSSEVVSTCQRKKSFDPPASAEPTCGQTGSARPVSATCVDLWGVPCRPVSIYIYIYVCVCVYISCCCWPTGVLACLLLLLLLLLYLQLQGTPGQGPGAFPSCTPWTCG